MSIRAIDETKIEKIVIEVDREGYYFCRVYLSDKMLYHYLAFTDYQKLDILDKIERFLLLKKVNTKEKNL